MKNRRLKKLIAVCLIFSVMAAHIGVLAVDGDIYTGLTGTENTNNSRLAITSITKTREEITVNGTFSSTHVNDVIAYSVYDKNNSAAIYCIGETPVNSDSTFTLIFGVRVEGTKTLVVELKASGCEEKAVAEITVSSSELEVKIAELETLFAQCETKGIATDYERVKYAAAKSVLNMVPRFLANKEWEAYDYNTDYALRLLSEAESALMSYLNGTATPLTGADLGNGTSTIDGGSFVDESGRPVFYIGYGHWNDIGSNDVSDYKNMGANFLHYEVGPTQLLSRASSGVAGWDSGYDPEFSYTMDCVDGMMKVNGAGNGNVWLTQVVDVQPNTTYEFGISIACDSATAIYINGGAGATQIYRSGDGAIDALTPKTAVFTTGPDQTTTDFIISVEKDTVNLILDDAFMREYGTEENLLDNGDFSKRVPLKVRRAMKESIRDVLETAQENGVNVVLMTAMHYFHTFLYDIDPTIVNGDASAFNAFMPFNPTHPLVLETLYYFVDELSDIISDYDCVGSICLINEPQFHVNETPDYYLQDYADFLEAKYKTLDAMNSVYGTAYKAFSEVPMPKDDERTNVGYFNDYTEFNASIVTQFHAFLAARIKENLPDMPITTKAMSDFYEKSTGLNRTLHGVNQERLDEVLDIHGGDPWATASLGSVQSKSMFYDYLKSISDKPVINSEDHILDDLETIMRSDAERMRNMADLWQGAVHGRNASAIWIWDKGSRTAVGSKFYNTNLTRRVDYIAGIGKVNLDLNRLANEVSAISNEQPRVAILYSSTSVAQNPHYHNAAYLAYTEALYHGEKVFFMNETSPEKLNEYDSLELLILPCTNYMKAETLEQIKTFLDKGKKVLMINGGGKAWLDENGKAHDSALLSAVTSRSESVSFFSVSDMQAKDTFKSVKNKLKTMLSVLPHAVEVSTNNETVEFQSTAYGGRYLINIINHGDADAVITLDSRGYDVSTAQDLITGTLLGARFTAKVNEPVLISIEAKDGFEFYEVNDDGVTVTDRITGHNLRVSVCKAGLGAGDAYVLVTGVYENNALKKVFMKEGSADNTGTVIDTLDVTIADDTRLEDVTVKSFLFRSLYDIFPYLPADGISYY